MDTYRSERDVSPQFYDRVQAWIRESGEVLVVLRYLRGGGAVDYALCQTLDEFKAIVDVIPIGTEINVCRGVHLPVRGVVSAEFISTATAEIAPDQDYIVLMLATEPATKISLRGDMGNTSGELLDFLAECVDHEVALGPCPCFDRTDPERFVSASKGGIDGPR